MAGRRVVSGWWARLAGALAVVSLLALSTPPGARGAESSPGTSTTPTLGAALRESTARELALVEHLRRQGVLFYGAWWCPACFKQKDLFGQKAGNKLPYVECEKTDEQRKRCEKAGIEAYPTWVKGNERLEGVQSLEKLGQWSGFGK